MTEVPHPEQQAEEAIEAAWDAINAEARAAAPRPTFDPAVVARALVRLARMQEGLSPEDEALADEIAEAGPAALGLDDDDG